MASAPQQDDLAIRPWLSEFRSAATERAFRDAVWPEWSAQTRLSATVAGSVFLVFVIVDFLLLGAREAFFGLLAVRLAVVAYLAWLVSHLRAPRAPAGADRLAFAAALIYTLGFCAVMALKPAASFLHTTTATVIVLSIYLFLPSRMVLTIAGGVLSSALLFAAAVAFLPLTAVDAVTFAAILTFCNLVGGATVIRLHALRRREFASLASLRESNAQLERKSEALKKLAKNLSRARDTASYANRAKSEFLAHMSHELRAPLNMILSFSDAIRHQVMGPISPPKYGEYADDIHDSAEALLALIEDLLEMAKAEAGRLRLDESTLDVAEAVDGAARLVSERAKAAGLELEVLLPERAPRLCADARMVKQILVNMLTNAIKFTPHGGRIYVEADVEADGALVIAVQDTGVGIPPLEVPKMLKPYARSELARRYDSDGSGLGLPLACAQMRLHGGRLELESAIGVGTTARVRFPKDRVYPREIRPAAATATGAAVSVGGRGT